MRKRPGWRSDARGRRGNSLDTRLKEGLGEGRAVDLTGVRACDSIQAHDGVMIEERAQLAVVHAWSNAANSLAEAVEPEPSEAIVSAGTQRELQRALRTAAALGALLGCEDDHLLQIGHRRLVSPRVASHFLRQ